MNENLNPDINVALRDRRVLQIDALAFYKIAKIELAYKRGLEENIFYHDILESNIRIALSRSFDKAKRLIIFPNELLIRSEWPCPGFSLANIICKTRSRL